jgi:hypothetical protein
MALHNLDASERGRKIEGSLGSLLLKPKMIEDSTESLP